MSPPSVVQNNAAAKTAVVPPFDLAVLLLLLGFAVMYLPTYYTLSQSAWGTDANGHGPMILGLCFWLLWRERKGILAPAPAAPVAGAVFLLLALACAQAHAADGRSHHLELTETGCSLYDAIVPADALGNRIETIHGLTAKGKRSAFSTRCSHGARDGRLWAASGGDAPMRGSTMWRLT